jgi:DNA polymerase/3'-5' exonuclease PolX
LEKDLILKEIEAIDTKYVATICGSFRRGLSASSDIDILITHPNYVSDTEITKSSKSKKSESKSTARELLEKIINKLTDLKIICDSLAFGDTKFMVWILSINKYVFLDFYKKKNYH